LFCVRVFCVIVSQPTVEATRLWVISPATIPLPLYNVITAGFAYTLIQR
jgi:hypothetical protein